MVNEVVDNDGKDDDDDDERGHWGSKTEFLLSCIGFSVSFILCL